jgi:hypothetical protein
MKIKNEEEKKLLPSQRIDSQIAELADWRGEFYISLRKLIHEVGPELTEEWKWGTGVWSQKENVLSIGAFKDHVRLTFFKGALLPDPEGLLVSGPDAKMIRSINFRKGDVIQVKGISALIQAAIAGYNPIRKN